jgi:flagellar M-ring protein FliF
MAVEEGEVGGGLLSNLTPRQRLVAMGSFVAIVVLLISLIVLLMGQKGEDKFVVIVKDLPAKSVGEAVAHLKEKKIAYEIRDEGHSIAVEKAKKDEAIIDLSMANLPHDGRVGFEIFGDKAGGFISTDFEKKVALQRAMNGELSRIVQKMNGIERAEVMIVVPEAQLFQEQQLPTTASVLVKLSGGGGFTQEQIEAITHLIASSVPGLKPQNVTISDTEGHMLAAGQGSGETESSKFNKELSKQLEIKKDIETKLQNKVTELLEKIVGPGHVQAKIEAKVNFDTTQMRIRNMTPVIDPKTNEPLPVAVKTLKERSTEPKFPEGGASMPGVSTNVANQTGTTATGTTQTSTSTTGAANTGGTINGDITTSSIKGTIAGTMSSNDKETDQKTMNFNNEEKLVTPAIGAIERLSASVTYQYGTPKAAAAGEEAAAEEGTGPKKLTEDDISKIVKDAIGYVENRDSLTVKEVVFDSTLQDMLKEQLAKADAAKKQIAWWWALVAGLVALVVGAGIGGALLGKKAPPPEAAGGFGGLPGGGDYAAIPGGPPGGAIPAPEGHGPEVAAPQDKVEVSRAPVTPPPDNPFGFLYGVEAETVANLLSSERLPTLVAVLAQLDPGQADDVITLLNPEIQSEVRSRLANNPVLPPMTQKMVSQSLKKRLQSLTAAV